MVELLRKKFVVVTTVLMVTLFGGFLVINNIYSGYWMNLEIVDMLEWISRSGIITAAKQEDSITDLVLSMTESEKPIVGLILDSDGNVLVENHIGNESMSAVPRKILTKMCQLKDSEFRVGRYYYTYTRLKDNTVLLVIMDTYANEHLLRRIMGGVLISAVAIGFLIIITFFLSEFITRPAEESLMREKRFIADASHELKTPVGAICINAQALGLSFGENIYIKNINSEAQRMSRLIDRLLTLSKYEEKRDIQKKEFDISSVCEEMALTYESILFEKNVQFEYAIQENRKLHGDADEIRQLLAILLDNALKHTEEGGQVNLTLSTQKDEMMLEVWNEGKGIALKDLPYVFDRFYTSDFSRGNHSFGLGLAIAKAIVERHDGTITVANEKEGTTFRIAFQIY